MKKAVSLFNCKKTSRPFKDFYIEWIETLKKTHLPLLRRSISTLSVPSSLLPTHVEMLHHHFQLYYDALDVAASNDIAQILFPDWRNSLEKPFLFLGDLHPYLFTNLLRSFLNDDEEDDNEIGFQIGEDSEFFDKPWHVVMAWKSPPKALMTKIEQIECGLRLMVPALVARARTAQAGFAKRAGAEWGRSQGRKEAARGEIREAVAAQMEEMRGVFIDANRLRRSVLSDILSVTSVYQAALFLEGLAQFLVGFRDHELLGEFNRCKKVLNC
ncbi:Protein INAPERTURATE POLLEN1 [Camellia lanceoleosa]|uniref:Protein INAPERTURATE POLLEN1 n=1 Tax=Camellia lanceoleosa TaxID=1840588 RepID=A0ACC0G4V5_9ERIC|nr:Protein INAPERTURATE POLLEN1 [Camellia lanceoleosa]